VRDRLFQPVAQPTDGPEHPLGGKHPARLGSKAGNPRRRFFGNNAFQAMVAISGRHSSPLFAGRFAAREANAIANSFVTLAADRVGQPVEGSGNAQPNVRPGRRA
jgi:hypothetical protein